MQADWLNARLSGYITDKSEQNHKKKSNYTK